MRQTPNGSIEYGPLEGPWIDVAPHRGRRLTPAEVPHIANQPFNWGQWNEREFNVPRIPRLRGFTGLLGYNAEIEVGVRVLWHTKRTPFDALREIERAEPDIPIALLALAFGAAMSQILNMLAPAVLAMVAARLPPAGHSALNGQRINELALRFLSEDDAGWPALELGKLDWCRFLWRIGALVWDPAIRLNLAQRRNNKDAHWPADLDLLAAVHLAQQEQPTARAAGIDVRVERTAIATAWPQVLEWDYHAIPPAALRFLTGGILREAATTLDSVPSERIAADFVPDLDLAASLITNLLREADTNAVYIPEGAFILELPEGYPLRSWGVSEMRIWAHPGGLWVGLRAPAKGLSISFAWLPGRPISQTMIAPEIEPLVHVTLSALWRDLRVAGERAVPERRRSAGAGSSSPATAKQQHQSTRLVLPRTRWLLGGERRSWSSDEERALITRRRHGVRGHLRLLPAGWARSEDAEAAAAEFGLILPDGKTFVRPHIRSEGEDSSGELVVVARGLATVMTLL